MKVGRSTTLKVNGNQRDRVATAPLLLVVLILKDSAAKRDTAFISYGPENTAVQSERYRYISYEDGSGELYDHQKDPHEWTNLSSNPEYAEIKKSMIQKVENFENK